MSEPVDAAASNGADAGRARFVHRELVLLLVLSAVAAAAFLLTRSAAAANRRLRLADAARWYDAGQERLNQGATGAAVAALRRASALDPDNRAYRILLARALAADHHEAAARQVLLGVRETTPEDPDLNVQLARLEARSGNQASAVRFYQSALYGSWSLSGVDERRRIRLELIRYLLETGQQRRAESEILVLSGNIPDEPDWHVEAGRLFERTTDPARALEQFRRALGLDPANGEALAGAGSAAFALGDYSAAHRFLQQAQPSAGDSLQLLRLTDLVLAHDPLLPRLSSGERLRRLDTALERAGSRLAACLALARGAAPDPSATASPEATQPPGTSDNRIRGRDELAALQAEAERFRTALNGGVRVKGTIEADTIEEGVALVGRIEEGLGDACDPLLLDRALVLIGRKHEGSGVER